MTQKRGLGRGLGALIPGAGSTPAPEQELRTRTRPTAGSDGEASGVRPVDMFFSGEQVSREEEKAQRERAGARDLATGMARAAAERRGRTGSSGGRRSAAARAAASAPEEESAQPTAADAPARTGSRSRKAGSGTTRSAASAASSSGTSAGATSSGTRSTGTRSSSTKSAATKSAASKSADTKSAGSRSEGTKAAAGKSTGSKAAGSTSAGTKGGSSTTTATKSTTKRAASSSKTSSAAKDAPATPPSPAPSKATTPTRTQASEPAQVEQPVEEPTAAVPAEAGAERPAPRRMQEQPAPSAADAASAAGSSREDSPVVDVEEVISTPAQQEPVEEVPAPASSEQDVAAQSSRPDDAAPETVAETVAEDGAEDEEPVEEALEEAADDRGLVSVPGAEFAEIPIHEVRENPRNPRTMFDDDELDELAHSLREVGVLQPVVVRPISVTADGESFELVMGERRWRAARRAGLESIPAIIRETSDDDLLRDALLENLHRSQLNPLEEANAYQQLLDDFGCTQDELGDRIGRSRPQITNTLRLLRLPALVQRRLASGALSAGHARALLSLDDPRLMEELAQRIVQEGLSVRAVERLVARGGQQQTTRTVRRSTYDPHVVDLTSRLSNRLETPVRIDVGKRKGRITLEFTNLDDLERLVENIGLDVSLPSGDDRSDG